MKDSKISESLRNAQIFSLASRGGKRAQKKTNKPKSWGAYLTMHNFHGL